MNTRRIRGIPRTLVVLSMLVALLCLSPRGVAQEVGRIISVDDVAVFSQPVGPEWLAKLTTVIQQAGYTCPKAGEINRIGRSSMGEEYHVSCGANLLHEITLGPGENDVGVIPKTDDAYETPLRKGVTESAENEVEVKGTLVIYKTSFGKISLRNRGGTNSAVAFPTNPLEMKFLNCRSRKVCSIGCPSACRIARLWN